jgi:iron complex outermembrane receptor protein
LTGKQFLDDANTKSYESYTVADLKAGYKMSVKQIKLNFYSGVNNLLDTKYASMILVNAPSFGGNLPRYYYPGIPRYFYFGLGINF